jgi:hypothetical protein
MGFSSQSGQILFREQATPGTFQADLPTAGVAMRTRSGTLSSNRELLIPDPEIGGGRDVNDAYLGPVSFSGDVEFYARMNSITSLLYGVLGAKAHSSTGVGTAEVHEHTITPIDVGSLPLYSVEEAVADGFEVFRYNDAKINTFHLEADANGYLMGTVGLIAKRQIAGATRTDAADPAGDGSDPPLWDETPMTVGTNILVTYAGLTLPAKSFSFDVNNNIEDDDFRLGSLYLGDMTEKRREVTMGVSIRPEDSDLWRQATYGTTAATQAGGLTTKDEVVITMSTYEVIGTSVANYDLEITVPQAIIAPYSVEPSGDDVIENDLEIRAVRPSAATPILTAVVHNGVEAVA